MVEELETMQVVLIAGKTFFALLFLLSGVSKLFQPRSTERMIYALHRAFRLRFRVWARFVAMTEIFLGAFLLFPLMSSVALATTLVIFLIFDAALVQLRLRGFYESCGCFGSLDVSHLGVIHYARNAALTLFAAGLLYLTSVLGVDIQPTAMAYGVGAVAFLVVAAIYRQSLRGKQASVSVEA